jgi:NlpC/P60 family
MTEKLPARRLDRNDFATQRHGLVRASASREGCVAGAADPGQEVPLPLTHPRRVCSRAALACVALFGAGGSATIATVGLAPAASATSAGHAVRDIAARPAAQALAALRRGDRSSYLVIRQQVAALVAPRVGLDPGALDAVWSRTDGHRMIAVLAALSQLGVAYHRRSAAPGQAFDCSGLTSWAWAQDGVTLPRQSGRQIRAVPNHAISEVRPGDLLYYPGHVMLALGVRGAMVHAPNTGNVVEVRMLSGRQLRRVRVGDPLDQSERVSPRRTWRWAASAVDGAGGLA